MSDRTMVAYEDDDWKLYQRLEVGPTHFTLKHKACGVGVVLRVESKGCITCGKMPPKHLSILRRMLELLS